MLSDSGCCYISLLEDNLVWAVWICSVIMHAGMKLFWTRIKCSWGFCICLEHHSMDVGAWLVEAPFGGEGLCTWSIPICPKHWCHRSSSFWGLLRFQLTFSRTEVLLVIWLGNASKEIRWNWTWLLKWPNVSEQRKYTMLLNLLQMNWCWTQCFFCFVTLTCQHNWEIEVGLNLEL